MAELRKRSFSSSSQKSGAFKNETVELKREFGIIGGISLVIGTMIGSGIFLSPQGILSNAKTVGASLCVWAGCGVLSTLCAITYIELGLMIRKSGGEYQYIKEAYGPVFGFLVAWTSVVVTKPSSFAIISIGFAQYVTAPFYPGCNPPVTAQKCAAIICILIITVINCFSVRWSKRVQVFFTGAKLAIIFAIIIGGFVMIAQGNTQYLENAFEGPSVSASAIALAFYSGLWSYDGWNQLNYISEEVQNPLRNHPIIIMIGIPLVTVVYVLVNIAYFTVMSPAELLASNAVAITFGDRVFGAWSWTVPLAVACSTFGAANGSAFTAGRITYAAGQNNHMPKIFSFVSVTKFTPSPALIFNSVLAVIMILPDASSFESLINYFTFASWIFYGAAFSSVVVMRYTRPNFERPYKVFIGIPIICTLSSLYLIVAPIIEEPDLAYLYASLFILGGLLFYFPIVHFGKRPPFMSKVTIFLQEIMEVVPPDDTFVEEVEEDAHKL